MQKTFSPEDLENIYLSLSLRKNLIETGNPLKDMAQAARDKDPAKPLDLHQKKLVIRTEELMGLCLQGMSKGGI